MIARIVRVSRCSSQAVTGRFADLSVQFGQALARD